MKRYFWVFLFLFLFSFTGYGYIVSVISDGKSEFVVFDDLKNGKIKVWIYKNFNIFNSFVIEKGKGPGEITVASSFGVDWEKRKIYVADGNFNKVEFYNLNGEYDDNIVFNFKKFQLGVVYKLKNGFLLKNRSLIGDEFLLVSKEGKIKKKLGEELKTVKFDTKTILKRTITGKGVLINEKLYYLDGVTFNLNSLNISTGKIDKYSLEETLKKAGWNHPPVYLEKSGCKFISGKCWQRWTCSGNLVKIGDELWISTQFYKNSASLRIIYNLKRNRVSRVMWLKGGGHLFLLGGVVYAIDNKWKIRKIK